MEKVIRSILLVCSSYIQQTKGRTSVSDNLSTAKKIAEDHGCSVATVNNKAKTIGVKLKGRTQEDHDRLLTALKDVKPRKRKAKAKAPAAKKASRSKAAKPDFSDVDAYFKHGKTLIAGIKKRLNELDKEKAQLTEKLNALLLMHPGSRD